jgi:spoIIIJ-associated protein
MEKWAEQVRQIFNKMGFTDFKVEDDAERRHVNVFVYDSPRLVEDNLPSIIDSLNHLMQTQARKEGAEYIYVDVNNYRREREHLITELARTAARKVQTTKAALSLPAMNSYERRLIHSELSTHPGVKTESEGEGKGRFVVIKPIEDQ